MDSISSDMDGEEGQKPTKKMATSYHQPAVHRSIPRDAAPSRSTRVVSSAAVAARARLALALRALCDSSEG